MQLRIAMVTADDLSQFKGGTIHLIEQAENLVRLGHRVTLYAPSDGRLSQACGARIRYLPAPLRGWFRQLIYDVSLLLVMTCDCLFGRVSIVHVRQMGYSISTLLAARLSGVPHVLEVNGILRDEIPSLSRFRAFLIDSCASANLNWSQAFTTTTPEHIGRLVDLYRADASRATAIACGVNLELFVPGEKNLARRKLAIDDGAFVMIRVGSLYSWGGVDQLLRAVANLSNRIGEWRLIIVGDGAERQLLQDLTKQLGLDRNVQFVGHVAYSTIPSYLAASDLGIVFYKATRSVSGDPMKIYEYMACGLPVLASDFPRYGGLVRKAGAGLAVNSEDPSEIEEAIIQMATDPDKRRQYGEAGVRAAADHSWLSRTRELESVLLRQVESRSRS